jgi:drug/metabolite transporter (DMT)-like permease
VNWRVHSALVTVQFLFAALTIAAKYVLPSIPPTGIVFFGITGAALAFVLIKSLTVRERVTERRDLLAMAGLALVGVVFNQIFFLEGVKRTTAINANILVTTVPAFTLAIALILRRERASLAKVGGIAFAAIGAVYLIGPDRIRLDPSTALGNTMIVLNTHSTFISPPGAVSLKSGISAAPTRQCRIMVIQSGSLPWIREMSFISSQL